MESKDFMQRKKGVETIPGLFTLCFWCSLQNIFMKERMILDKVVLLKVISIEPSLKKNIRLIESRGSIAIGEPDLQVGIAVFPPSYNTGLHSHSSEQLMYILEGKGIIGTENEQTEATPGKAFLIPRGENHFQVSTKEGGFKFLFVLAFPNETKLETGWMEGISLMEQPADRSAPQT